MEWGSKEFVFLFKKRQPGEWMELGGISFELEIAPIFPNTRVFPCPISLRILVKDL
jgi:hypothetical protein